MTNVMSKFLNMGIPLQDVIRLSTYAPAQNINRPDLGHLTPGAVADVAVLRLVEGDFGFVDAYDQRRMKGTKKLIGELTLREGEVVWDLNGRTHEDWAELVTEADIDRAFFQRLCPDCDPE